jgi:murein DD-endopeptidase MepM/ murein hydrolase activator NlpD
MFAYTITSLKQTIRKILYSPFGFQLGILSFFLWFLTSFQPTYIFWKPEPFGEQIFFHKEKTYSITEAGFIDNFAGIENAGLSETFVEDEDGNLIKKMVPRQQTKAVDYTIKSGDTLLKISHKFGLNISTLLWANNLTAKENIIPGQVIKIPPTDGVYYIVELGDTLSEIAQWHDIKMADIFQYNNLNREGSIQRGQEIFLPNAKRIYVEHTPFQPPISSIVTSPQPIITSSSVGFSLKKPTTGSITQGVRPGHTALDIANSINTPIYASAGGTITVSQDGWNYGYGKYIIIDHGNNIQTLYAHLNTRDVAVGQQVKKGELIGKMGNSGNVIGPTGIHLHFEVRVNGRKMNPNNYF